MKKIMTPVRRQLPTLPGLFIAVGLCGLSLPVLAQVGFVADLMTSELCLFQNWNTPEVQAWLKKKPREERMALYGDSRFGPAAKRCLIETRPAAIAACNKVIAQTLSYRKQGIIGGGKPYLDDKELGAILEPGMACLSKEDVAPAVETGMPDGWLPADLQPQPSVFETLKRAAQGDLPAQLEAVKLYTDGKALPPSDSKRGYWLRKAATGGDLNSQIKLATAYQYGSAPFEKNIAEAVNWLQAAARQGNDESLFELGLLYSNESKTEEAKKWYAAAAAKGHGKAAYFLANIYRDQPGATRNQAKRIEWLRRGSQLHSSDSMSDLALELEQGKAASAKDRAEAQALRREAALKCGQRESELANYYPWGKLPARDAERIKVQKQHAGQGDIDAQLALAVHDLFVDRKGAEESRPLWLKKAAAAGDPIAQVIYGRLLNNGQDGVKQDRAQALDLYLKAAAQGSAAAEKAIAEWYIAPDGVFDRSNKKNIETGMAWIRKALAHHCESAPEWLAWAESVRR